MSAKNVGLFFKALDTNKAMREKLGLLAKTAGFEFSAAELQEYLQAAVKTNGHNLADAELGMVAGGFGDTGNRGDDPHEMG